MPQGSADARLYRPKVLTVLAEGYGLDALRRDAAAGLTVAVVALPLSMAIAVASGVSPDRGLYSVIVGGFLVSALGGSRFQIGGPAGAFIVLVAATVAQFGVEGMVLAVMLSGLLMTALGLMRVGGLIRHIPHPVVVGFTAAIATTIAASQLTNLLGLRLGGPEPGPLIPKLAALARAASTIQPAAVCLGLGVAATILILRRLRPGWPGMLIAIAASALVSTALGLPVETIGARFGALAHGLPAPRLPTIDVASLMAVAPAALSFTLLGGIESLLSAKIADDMTGRRHRSNMELVAQGLANIGAALFGGICVTGTIARTATNVRAGARSPVSGMLHAVFLLAILMLAAPLASYVPLAALAGVLVVVAWNMLEPREIGHVLRDPRAATVLLATFGVTVVWDLSRGVTAGCILATVFWAHARIRRRLAG